jgi:hypothetical protein
MARITYTYSFQWCPFLDSKSEGTFLHFYQKEKKEGITFGLGKERTEA